MMVIRVEKGSSFPGQFVRSPLACCKLFYKAWSDLLPFMSSVAVLTESVTETAAYLNIEFEPNTVCV